MALILTCLFALFVGRYEPFPGQLWQTKNAHDEAQQVEDEYSLILQDKPIEFYVHEFYIASRTAQEPFEIKEVISLNSLADRENRPYFGPKR